MSFEAPVELFPMNEHDLNAVVALEARVQEFPWTHGHFSDSMRAGHSCWICRVGGDLAGFSVVMPVVDEAHLLNIGVCPARQGKGLGARLLRQAMEVARLNGSKAMLLEVRVSNVKAAELYRHFGFQQIGLRRGYYPAASGREDGLVFRRELP